MKKHYLLTLRPDEDKKVLRKIVARADFFPDGTATFHYMPRSDGHNCPMGVDIYTPYGWNMLRQTAEAFDRGEEVFFEAWA